MKINELDLYQLDYLVAKAEFKNNPEIRVCILNSDNKCYIDFIGCDQEYSPTSNPSQGWPIIERDRIDTNYIKILKVWKSNDINIRIHQYGGTSLEAAMRCKVASVYGDEVEI